MYVLYIHLIVDNYGWPLGVESDQVQSNCINTDMSQMPTMGESVLPQYLITERVSSMLESIIYQLVMANQILLNTL